MLLPASYANGFAPRDGEPLFPELWRSCVFAAAPCLGPTGLVLRDWSGLGNHGTLTGGPTWSVIRGRYALSFDQADDYVLCGSTGIPVDGNLGVSVWVKLSGSAARQAIVVRSNAAYLINWACVYSQGGTQRFSFWNTAAFGPELTTTVVADTNWHHLYFGRTGGAGSWTIKISLDGVITRTTTTRDPQSSAPFSLSVGRWGATAAEYFGGEQDDIRIFSTEPSDAQIRLMASRRGIAYELAPVRYYGETLAAYNRRLQAAQLVGGGLVG